MLFAQDAAAASQTLSVTFWLALVVPIVILILVASGVVLLVRHLRFNREKLHMERLKMIEMGYPLEDSESSKRQEKFMHNAFWISFWLVVAVPSGVFSAAATATDGMNAGIGVLLAIWIGAAVTGVAAVVCAAILMVYSRFHRDEIDNEPRLPSKPAKNP